MGPTRIELGAVVNFLQEFVWMAGIFWEEREAQSISNLCGLSSIRCGDVKRDGREFRMMDLEGLDAALGSAFPLVIISTHEEPRTLALIKRAATHADMRLAIWTVTDGLNGLDPLEPPGRALRVADLDPHISKHTTDATTMLRTVRGQKRPGLFVLLDFHPFVQDPVNIRLIKEIAQDFEIRRQKIIFISHELELPKELTRFAMRAEVPLPNHQCLRRLVDEEAKVWSFKAGGRSLEAEPRILESLAHNLSGLTFTDATRLVRNAMSASGTVTSHDVKRLREAKHQLVGEGSVLSFHSETAHFGDVGGFTRLKNWLEKRRKHFLNGSGAVDAPKGILLLGVQGAGKSLAAKAVAGVWEIPLLRLDFGALYNKFFGETERNLREALATAAALSPCVLWIDEIEKGISAGDYDSGTSRRILATLLTWLAERRERVFVVATANDISALPPELMRKGRYDEIFFVDLPGEDVRARIFAIHLAKRGFDPVQFDLVRLAQSSVGFSGAEIEQAVIAATYCRAGSDETLSTMQIEAELQVTKPLSVTMAEDMRRLRSWALDRTVKVD